MMYDNMKNEVKINENMKYIQMKGHPITELRTQNSELRTQTFIYLTNNVYNYI